MLNASNPYAQYKVRKDEINDAVRRVLESGWYILGREVSAFEEKFASYTGVEYAIGVGSGTEALQLALVACGIGPGDEVITVSHTAIATVAAIVAARATPVFVDVDETGTLDPRCLEMALSDKTKAIVPVHLYGRPCAMNKIMVFARKNGLKVIEDCAQATGALCGDKRVGSIGDAGCFSFYPTKNLGGMGDGGMVTVNDSAIAGKIRSLREYGWDDKRVARCRGINSRLDELQAAVLDVKLAFLDTDNGLRYNIARFYTDRLKNVPARFPELPENKSGHVFHLYVVRTEWRDRLKEFLYQKGIQAGIHYPLAAHQQQGFAPFVRIAGDLKETEKMVKEILSLPMYPELTADEQVHVVDSVKEFFKNIKDQEFS